MCHVEWARTATSYCSIVLGRRFEGESQELACAVEAGYGDPDGDTLADLRTGVASAKGHPILHETVVRRSR